MLHINYGINRKRRHGGIEHACGKLWLEGDWNDRTFHEAIHAAIYKANPGWLITGYSEATPKLTMSHCEWLDGIPCPCLVENMGEALAERYGLDIRDARILVAEWAGYKLRQAAAQAEG